MATASHLAFERDIIEIQEQIDKLLGLAERKGIDVSAEVIVLREKLQSLKEQTYDNLRPMEQVQVARHPHRLGAGGMAEGWKQAQPRRGELGRNGCYSLRVKSICSCHNLEATFLADSGRRRH